MSSACAAQPVWRDPPAVRPAAPGPARPAAAGRAGPGVDLQIELRLVAEEDSPASPGSDDRVVSTLNTAPPRGGRLTRTQQPADDAQGLPTLRVRQGATVRADFNHWQGRSRLDWVWTPQGAGLQGGTRFELARTSVQLQPVWPGGQAPVDLRWAVSLPQAGAADAPPDAVQAEGRLSVPLDAWVRLAALAPAAPAAQAVGTQGLQRGTEALAPHTRWLSVRISRLP